MYKMLVLAPAACIATVIVQLPNLQDINSRSVQHQQLLPATTGILGRGETLKIPARPRTTQPLTAVCPHTAGTNSKRHRAVVNHVLLVNNHFSCLQLGALLSGCCNMKHPSTVSNVIAELCDNEQQRPAAYSCLMFKVLPLVTVVNAAGPAATATAATAGLLLLPLVLLMLLLLLLS